MLLLVTGHNGFLGSNFIRYIQTKGIEYTTLQKDLLDESILKEELEEEYIIVHFAGNKNNDIDLSIRNNVEVTSNIVRMAQSEMCRGLIYISSIAVYGAVDEVICETTGKNATTNYAKSKMICEDIVKCFMNNKSYVIVRPTNIYDGVNIGVIKQINDCIDIGAKFDVWQESYDAKRDYISLQNVIEGIYEEVKFIGDLKNRIIQSEINLGSGFSYSVKDIIHILENKKKKKININMTKNENFIKYDLVIKSEDSAELLKGKIDKIEDCI